MKPSEISEILRRIASKIDNSESPQRSLVAKDLRRVIMAVDESILDTWVKVGPGLFNEEASSLSKHEIEDMETDREYETEIIWSAVSAWDNWVNPNKPDFSSLSSEEKLKVISDALGEGAEYGWYRGDASDPQTITEILSES
jgi:hypothetical protein